MHSSPNLCVAMIG